VLDLNICSDQARDFRIPDVRFVYWFVYDGSNTTKCESRYVRCNKTSLGFCSLSCRPKQSLLSMVAPPSSNDTASGKLVRRYLSMCAKGVLSGTGDAFCHDRSAETTHKLHKQHVKVASRVRLL